MSDYIRQNGSSKTEFSADAGWVLLSPAEAKIKQKIEAVGVPLKKWDINIYRGILTGYNEAFIIDKKKRDELIAISPKNAEIIRPILKGRDIKKYKAAFDDRWIIFTRRGIDMDQYPAVKDHLHQYYENLKPKSEGDRDGRKPGTYKWYEIQDNVAYYQDFYKEKVIWIELSDEPKFSYDTDGYFVEATAFIITGKHLKYLTAFFNSQLCDWYFDKITTTSGVGTNRWKKIYIEHLPIPNIDAAKEEQFEKMIDNINQNDTDTLRLDCAINKMILDLYDFSPDETAVLTSFRK